MPARRRASATTAMCLPGRASMRRAQVQRVLAAGGPAAEDRERGLNEQPAHARGPGLGDRVAALRGARAVLPGHEAEVGFELMGVGEARDVVDGGEEGGGGDGADAGTERRRGTRGSWTARCSIVASEYASCWLR